MLAGIMLVGFSILGLACAMRGPAAPQASDRPPVIMTLPDSLAFVIDPAKSNSADQSISVMNASDGVFTWSMSDNAHWIYLKQAEGAPSTGKNKIQVMVDAAGMSPGNYTGIVTIVAEGAINSPVHVPVYLNIISSAEPPAVIPEPSDIIKQMPQPGSAAVMWRNQTDFMAYASTNACIVSGSITNNDRLWCMRDVKIVAKSGDSASIASTIPPGETVMYCKFIPCFERQEVDLQYTWQPY